MSTDQHSRTEAPTLRKREEAREKGDVAVSRDLTTGVAMFAATSTLYLWGGDVGRGLLEMVRSQLLHLPFAELGTERLQTLSWSLAGRFSAATAGLVLAVASANLLVAGLQSGMQVTLKPLTPDWNRLNPVSGWGRLFSSSSAMRGLMGIVKTAALAAIVFLALRKKSGLVATAGDGSVTTVVAFGWELVLQAAFAVATALVAIGITDYLFQRWRFENKLKMTRQELKDERKQDEGDPMMRARIKRVQREMAQRRMLQDVPQASVVLTNPTHYAVALKYEQGEMMAPRVVAKGVDEMAKRIRHIAQEHDVPVLERRTLARALYKSVEVGDEIPPALYQAIAEIVAYLYRLGRFR